MRTSPGETRPPTTARTTRDWRLIASNLVGAVPLVGVFTVALWAAVILVGALA